MLLLLIVMVSSFAVQGSSNPEKQSSPKVNIKNFLNPEDSQNKDHCYVESFFKQKENDEANKQENNGYMTNMIHYPRCSNCYKNADKLFDYVKLCHAVNNFFVKNYNQKEEIDHLRKTLEDAKNYMSYQENLINKQKIELDKIQQHQKEAEISPSTHKKRKFSIVESQTKKRKKNNEENN